MDASPSGCLINLNLEALGDRGRRRPVDTLAVDSSLGHPCDHPSSARRLSPSSACYVSFSSTLRPGA